MVKPNDPVAGRVWQVVAHARYFIVRNDPCRGLWSPKTSGRPNQGSPKTGSTVFDVFDVFAYVVLPVVVAIVFVVAISALIVRKRVEMRNKEMNLNAAEETPLVRKIKRHQKRRGTKHKLKKEGTSK